MAAWAQFIADVSEHMPALISEAESVTHQTVQYQAQPFPQFSDMASFISGAENGYLAKADPSTTSLLAAAQAAPSPSPSSSKYSPFAMWITYLKYYKTTMTSYIDYQITALETMETQWKSAFGVGAA